MDNVKWFKSTLKSHFAISSANEIRNLMREIISHLFFQTIIISVRTKRALNLHLPDYILNIWMGRGLTISGIRS